MAVLLQKKSLNGLLAEVTGKGLPALMDKERGSAAGSEQDQDNAVVEADLLSDMGGKLVKEDAKTRLNRMVKLLQTVKGEVGAKKGKPLDKALTDLKKLLKQGGKMTMDQAKQHLFDAALEIKKVKKAKEALSKGQWSWQRATRQSR